MYLQHMSFRMRREITCFGGIHRWFLFRGLPIVILVSLGLLLLWIPRAAAQIGAADSTAVEAGQLLLRQGGEGEYVSAVLQRSEVHFDISGMIATVRLEQSFHNDSDGWVEGVYVFPLPDDAAVRAMEMVVGERRIVGKIRERAEAEKIYKAARDQGKKASLVEQQRPNMFTNRIANMAPGETIAVTMEYIQPVTVEGDLFSLRYPMTITPRYMPGSPTGEGLEQRKPLGLMGYNGWAVPTDQVPDAPAISPLLYPQEGDKHRPLNPIRITARLAMGLPLAEVLSPYHEIAMTRSGSIYDIHLADDVSEMDRDFVLSWRPVTGSAPSAAFFSERVGEEHFGLLMLLPPAAERAGESLPRELVFLVDTSGSIGGVPIDQARASVSHALRQLRPKDRFNIIEFNSHVRSLYRSSVPATRHHVQKAQEFVRQLQASGGTEMLPALRAALTVSGEADMHREQLPVRQVIFITDGAVGNELALYEEITRQLGHSRLFTVGIGSAPNSWFMRKAAQAGRGAHTHIGDLAEVGEKMVDLFDRLARPAAVDLAIEWPAAVEVWPEFIPDLYLGQPMLVAANFGTVSPRGDIVVRGELAGQSWSQTLRLSDGADPAYRQDDPGVASIWAGKEITALLDQRVTGRSEADVRSDVLEVALQHQLMSPYTSFVAVEEIVSRPERVEMNSKALPNTQPRGQGPQQFAYPQGATAGPLQLWSGSFALFLALLLWVMGRGDDLSHSHA